MELNNLNEMTMYAVMIRLTLATICGALIGIDRGTKSNVAGVRTHVLVCMGAAMAMMTNQHMAQGYETVSNAVMIGTQVISGIALLGAGTIIVTGKQQVKGGSATVGLWASGVMGLAIGVGFYEGAVLGCLLLLVVVAAFQRLEKFMARRSKTMVMYMEIKDIKKCKHIIRSLKRKASKVSNIEINRHDEMEDDTVGLLCKVKLNELKRDTQIIKEMKELEGVAYIEDIA